MKRYVVLKVVGICLLLLGARSVAMAQDDSFAEAEKRALSKFELEEESVSKSKFTTQFSVQLTEVRVRYEEHVTISDTESNWDAWMTRGDLMLSSYYKRDSGNDVGIEIDFGLFHTGTEEENWDIQGGNNQRNDTDFNGWEFKLGIGWIRDFDSPWELKQVLSYGYRVIEFDRKNFIINGVYQNTSPVAEEYTIDYLEYSPHFTFEEGEGGFFSFKPSFAYVMNSEADNDAFNVSIEGDGGFIAGIDTRLGYQLTEDCAGYIGILGEWQYLEGNTIEDNGALIEWPNNNLFTYGVNIGLTFDFDS